MKTLLLSLIITQNLNFNQQLNSCRAKIKNYIKSYDNVLGMILYSQAPTIYGGIGTLLSKVDYSKISIFLTNKLDIVRVAIIIDSNGYCICDSVLTSSNIKLNVEAIRVVNNLKYNPAMNSNRNVESFMIVPVYFHKLGADYIKRNINKHIF